MEPSMLNAQGLNINEATSGPSASNANEPVLEPNPENEGDPTMDQGSLTGDAPDLTRELSWSSDDNAITDPDYLDSYELSLDHLEEYFNSDLVRNAIPRLRSFIKPPPYVQSPPKPRPSASHQKYWYLVPGDPSPLINVREFLDSFIQKTAQEDNMWAQDIETNFLSPEEEERIAKNCSVEEVFKISHQFFADPTIFSLLRKYRSGDYEDEMPLELSATITSNESSKRVRLEENLTSKEKSKNQDTASYNDINLCSYATTTIVNGDTSINGDSTISIDQDCPKIRRAELAVESSRDNSPDENFNSKNSATFTPLPSDSSSTSQPTPLTLDPNDSNLDNVSESFIRGGLHRTSTSVSSMPSGPSSPLELHSYESLSCPSSPCETVASHRSSPQSPEEESEREPEPSAMHKRFWEMAKKLDNSCLASLKQVNRVNAPAKKRQEMNYVAAELPKLEEETATPIEQPMVVLSVAFYDQHKPAHRMQEFLVLGNQTLGELRDAFYCKQDFQTYDVAELDNPITNLNTTTKKLSSSYFFIENTFYNDKRHPAALDYSKIIINWANENDRVSHARLAQYESKVMDQTTFLELTIQLNKPYIFCHQGDCQHAVIFRDLRLLQLGYDWLDLKKYPRAIFRNRIQRNKCRMCSQRPADLVTLDDVLAGETPFYYCRPCFELFHYAEDGNLLFGNFKVYPYIHEN
ncbi:hypothetical protein G9A89_008369 [Geosiphon pyriformis]|nr:hypothetical protein G9A89_008369 [Geosiphon pyriformis]